MTALQSGGTWLVWVTDWWVPGSIESGCAFQLQLRHRYRRASYRLMPLWAAGQWSLGIAHVCCASSVAQHVQGTNAVIVVVTVSLSISVQARATISCRFAARWATGQWTLANTCLAVLARPSEGRLRHGQYAQILATMLAFLTGYLGGLWPGDDRCGV